MLGRKCNCILQNQNNCINFAMTLRREALLEPESGRSLHSEKRLLRLILGYQKCGNFSTIVRNEVTVDVSGMVACSWMDYIVSVCPF